jgi:hypothetical protein
VKITAFYLQRPKSGIVENMTVTIQEPRMFPAWTMVISIQIYADVFVEPLEAIRADVPGADGR